MDFRILSEKLRKARVLSTGQGTGSKVRVLIESGDHRDKWGTVGVSKNIIEASGRLGWIQSTIDC